MKSWHRCAAGAVASALFLLLAAPALAQSPATPPATSAPETLPAPPVPAEAAPPRPEPPAVRPLQAQKALDGRPTALTALVRAALHEVRLSGESSSDAGIKERSASRFTEIARAEARSMRFGMAVLATLGATSPFVGLFGTVWGIMNSFIGISKAQTTNLAVVAPGIAEALLATAIGLVAAIPAVIIYNHFSRATKAYLEYVGRGSGAVGRLLSRDLDRSRDRLLARAAE
jgi:biopolymer transport protein ExbB